MMTAAVLAAVLVAHSSEKPPLTAADIHCSKLDVHYSTIRPAKLSKLAELPPARQELAVSRMIGRCSFPAIVARDVEADRAAPVRRGDGLWRRP